MFRYPVMRTLRRDSLALAALCVVLAVLWLPTLRYPVFSDTTVYWMLGKSVWTTGTYAAFGLPYDKHLPLHAIVSYPLSIVAGIHTGMHLSSLFAGMATVLAAYAFIARSVDRAVALWTAALLVVHHGFLYLTMNGGGDLLFAALWTSALWCYVRAADDTRWYAAAGAAAGLACLTRYNGLALFPLFFVWAVYARRRHLRSSAFWLGGVVGLSLFSLWLLRNTLTFGNPLHSGYTGEYSDAAPSLLAQLFDNIVFYIQPQQNILPLLLLAAVWGIAVEGRRRSFLLLSMLAAWPLTAVWWVQGMRFAMPGYIALLAFGCIGLRDLLRRCPLSLRIYAISLCAGVLVLTHGSALCLYTYGACNAWFDRTVGWLPQNLGLTTEGLYASRLAREELNRRAPRGATVAVPTLLHPAAGAGVYRSDLRIVDAADPTLSCPYYTISQYAVDGGDALFVTTAAPRTTLYEVACR